MSPFASPRLIGVKEGQGEREGVEDVASVMLSRARKSFRSTSVLKKRKSHAKLNDFDVDANEKRRTNLDKMLGKFCEGVESRKNSAQSSVSNSSSDDARCAPIRTGPKKSGFHHLARFRRAMQSMQGIDSKKTSAYVTKKKINLHKTTYIINLSVGITSFFLKILCEIAFFSPGGQNSID